MAVLVMCNGIITPFIFLPNSKSSVILDMRTIVVSVYNNLGYIIYALAAL